MVIADRISLPAKGMERHPKVPEYLQHSRTV